MVSQSQIYLFLIMCNPSDQSGLFSANIPTDSFEIMKEYLTGAQAFLEPTEGKFKIEN